MIDQERIDELAKSAFADEPTGLLDNPEESELVQLIDRQLNLREPGSLTHTDLEEDVAQINDLVFKFNQKHRGSHHAVVLVYEADELD